MMLKAPKILNLLFLILFAKLAFAQDSELNWAIKPSYSVLWYNGELGSNFSNISHGGEFLAATYLNPSFDLLFGAGYYALNLNGSIEGENYYSKGNIIAPSLLLNYKLANGYLFTDSMRLKPYLGLGFNYMIGKTKGVSYNWNGDPFSHFIDEVGLKTVVGLRYDFTRRFGLFVEWNAVLASTEELDGAAIDMNNDKFGGFNIGVVINITRVKDQDKDGVPDNEDDCPDTPLGVKVDENGCPLDGDKDGIPDYLDDCPDIPGLPEYNGCPDTDGDGIIDKEDDCPELPGEPEHNGCPDSDGDGVIDSDDICPDTPPEANVDRYGCPVDTDGDGLADYVDQCPEEYGPMEYMGCPEPPDVGWPETQKETPPEVYFETNESELSPEAEEEMMKLVRFMVENSTMNIRLFGSADPRGSKEYNKKLSDKRVQAAKKFLMRKGIPENRIIIRSLGEPQETKFNTEEENLTEEQKLRKYRKVMFQTFFFMR